MNEVYTLFDIKLLRKRIAKIDKKLELAKGLERIELTVLRGELSKQLMRL